MSVTRTSETGEEGERIAREFLKNSGMEIIETNFRFRHGEIDIIARDGDYLVFCEVKTRRNDEYGPPECAVTTKKQQQVRKIAERYLYVRGIHDQACRFDVVAIRMTGVKAEINHLRNAF